MRVRSIPWVVRAVPILLALAALAEPGAGQGPGNGKGGGNGGGGGGKKDTLPANPDVVFGGVGKRWQPSLELLDSSTGETGTLLADARGAAWSPDGSELAYVRPSTGEIRIIAADGSSGRTVTVAGPGAYRVDWSRANPPNGRAMLLWADDAGIHAVATDGSERTLLKAGASWDTPRWSPSGDRFVAGTFVNYGDQLVVHTVAVVGGTLTIVDEYPLTHGPDNPFGQGYTASTSYDWSNSGDWIVFLSREVARYPEGDLWLIDPSDPTRYVRLTFTPENEEWPTFDASDDRIFYVDTSSSSTRRVYAIDVVPDPAPQLVLSHKDVREPRAVHD